MKDLSQKIGECELDGLITSITPDCFVGGGVVAKGASATTLPRGAVLAKTEAGKLILLGSAEGATANCILCDEVEVGTEEDVTVAVYLGGCFDPNKVTVADAYTMTESDKDELRKCGIVFKAAQ